MLLFVLLPMYYIFLEHAFFCNCSVVISKLQNENVKSNLTKKIEHGEIKNQLSKNFTNGITTKQENLPKKRITEAPVNHPSISPNIMPKNNLNFTFYERINSNATRSKNAIWATLALTFLCVVLLLSVAQSKMWKDYHGSESQGIPLPNFNERVPLKEVMERKIAIVKELLSKKKKKKPQFDEAELESLLSSDLE